ncbi:flavodoxin [Caloramator mitchellensis]|uniref:Flavodoxin n=1 Tax=Caloramator mitchellensis TaxID=908809 RepID=A0A0R3JT64_CALMK|nr:flavodoxin [Caloramator mitchellensis]KRQ86704.1 flavodoxin [Caloramator mitchellensis]
MGKGAIVYFSMGGNTEFVAGLIQRITGFDLINIKPMKELRYKGFLKVFIGGKMALFGETPEIKDLEKDINGYDTIIIGTPVWAGRPNPYVNTFVSKYDLKGKKVALFACCAGDPNKTFDILKGKIKGNVTSTIFFKEALKNKNLGIEEKIKEWVKSII